MPCWPRSPPRPPEPAYRHQRHTTGEHRWDTSRSTDPPPSRRSPRPTGARTSLTDVTRTGEWSHETQGGEWLDGATAPAPDGTHSGRNRNGRTKWSRICEIDAADTPQVVSWHTVPTRLYPDSTRWTYELASTDTGCRIAQHFEVLKLNAFFDWLFYAIIPARDRTEALTADLVRLGEVAATEVATPSV